MLCCCYVKTPEGLRDGGRLPKAANFKSLLVPRIALLCLARAPTAGLQMETQVLEKMS